MESQITRMARRLNPLGYVFISTGIVFYLMRYDFINFLAISEQGAFLASILAIGYRLAILMLNYLRGERDQTSDDGYLKDELKVLRNELAHGRYSKSEIEENRKR